MTPEMPSALSSIIDFLFFVVTFVSAAIVLWLYDRDTRRMYGRNEQREKQHDPELKDVVDAYTHGLRRARNRSPEEVEEERKALEDNPPGRRGYWLPRVFRWEVRTRDDMYWAHFPLRCTALVYAEKIGGIVIEWDERGKSGREVTREDER